MHLQDWKGHNILIQDLTATEFIVLPLGQKKCVFFPPSSLTFHESSPPPRPPGIEQKWEELRGVTNFTSHPSLGFLKMAAKVRRVGCTLELEWMKECNLPPSDSKVLATGEWEELGMDGRGLPLGFCIANSPFSFW